MKCGCGFAVRSLVSPLDRGRRHIDHPTPRHERRAAVAASAATLKTYRCARSVKNVDAIGTCFEVNRVQGCRWTKPAIHGDALALASALGYDDPGSSDG